MDAPPVTPQSLVGNNYMSGFTSSEHLAQNQPLEPRDDAVRQRYSAAAGQPESALCCPVNYAPELLQAIPEEILEKDYGCGDPSPFVNAGETVLDLGSGGGKLCYIAAQIVGAAGQVIGVDYNPDMLALARKYQATMAERLGFANTDFRCGKIEDLGLNLELLAEKLRDRPIRTPDDWLAAQQLARQLRTGQPLVADGSVDCVVSNCVLNLVDPAARKELFREILRVLRVGGRAAISDIVSDEDVPVDMQQDGHLWSGCISGAWREDRFLEEFVEAGFQGVQIARLEREPWQTIRGIEFRAMTVVAIKPDPGPCLERNQAVIYRGPFVSVQDEDGRTYRRGQRTAVCDKTFRLLHGGPFASQFVFLQPHQEIPLNQASLFDCAIDQLRDPRQTKGGRIEELALPSTNGCGTTNCC